MILTTTLDDTSQAEYNQLMAERGADVLATTLTGWLDARRHARLREDIESIRAGTADLATKARIRSALKL